MQAFVDAVEQAYLQSDDDRAMLEHSMETVSEELVDRFQRLQDALAESQLAKTELDQAVSVLSATLDSTADGILVVDIAGRIAQLNRKFIDLWRIPDHVIATHQDRDALNFVLDQLIDPEAFMTQVNALNATPEAESVDVLLFKDGRIYERYSMPHRISGEIAGRVWSFRDVTGKRQLEEQLRQSQKMEAVGALAGGIAHDFNNLLTVIHGHAELLAEGPANSEGDERQDLAEIIKAADRAAALTHQLLAFSRKQVLKPVALDLNDVVASLMTMLRRLIGENIEVCTILAPALGVITVDAGQMEQVIVNLVVNARDAMPQGGRVEIQTENVVLDESREYERVNGLPSGSFVALTVSDTGHGISADVRDRVFEPFFTTKAVGKGTGLGLATVFGVVKQSGGHVVLESEVGRGASFRIYVPRCESLRSRTPQSVAALPRIDGTETILVAEDEAAVRRLVRRILHARGYNALIARDDKEATHLAAEHAGSIALLLTDVVMPGMGGVELAAQIQRLSPGIRVLYMTGHSADDADRNGALSKGANLIQKPFTTTSLALAVRAAIDQAE
jgi:signal transduction histidine kinase/CheY-like chemotaxis protein